MVVIANLQEAYDGKDVSRTGDMDVFVRRLTSQLDYDPDVLLLQEVRHSSATYVARRLSAATGASYSVAVDPGSKPTRFTRRKTYQHDTAILLNRDTMAGSNKKGFLGTATKRRDMRSGRVPVVKHNAYLLATEKAGGMAFPLMSVHLSPDGVFKKQRLAVRRRNAWAGKIANFMSNKFSGAPGPYFAVGGDFNGPRCPVSGGDNCSPSKFYANLIGRGYRDSVRDVVVVGGVDFIFTKTGVYEAGVDSGYNPKRDRFYSDHQFRWSLLGPDRSRPTAPTNLRDSSGNPTDVNLEWDASTDTGDSGVDRYAVWRRGTHGKWQRLEYTDQTRYSYAPSFPQTTYDYHVVAFDGAHNASPRSQIISVKATTN